MSGTPSAPAPAPRRGGLAGRLGALALGLPYLINVTAYAAVTSIAVIGLYIAYVIPTLLRLRKGDAFERGPWHLGRWSRAIGVVSVAWVAVITVLFMLPQVSPVTWETFNYAPVAVLVVLGFAAVWWFSRRPGTGSSTPSTRRPSPERRHGPPRPRNCPICDRSRSTPARRGRVPDTRSETRPRPAMLGEATSRTTAWALSSIGRAVDF